MISKASATDFSVLQQIWEGSVKKTHHFLDKAYFEEIKSLLPAIFPAVPIYVHRNQEGVITGFLGVGGDNIDMLFIHPDHMGRGIGRTLIQYALQELKARKVDVNEQNEGALEFYKRCGFVVVGRSEVDGLGRPYPLLHMEYRKS